jgi:hypothetical protein
VASASGTDPVDPVGQVQSAVNSATGGDGATDPGSAPSVPDLSGTGDQPGGFPGLPGLPGTPGTGDPSAGGDPTSGLSPDALRALFIQALGPLGISADCVNGVFDGFENVVAALQNSNPQQLQDLLNQLVGALQNGGQGFDPSSLSDNDVAKALQDLATTLQDTCMPATPPAPGSHNTPPPAASQPVVPAAQPAAPAAAAPVAQPASYPGYAPTGGTPDESSSPVPLAVLGGVVLLSGAAAAGYRMSTRGARSRG